MYVKKMSAATKIFHIFFFTIIIKIYWEGNPKKFA